jgi:hypothetical protein
VPPTTFDCVKLIIVRAGAALLLSELGTRHINVGDVVVLAANTLCGAEPEGWITTMTIYLDRDYVIDQVFWQYAEQFTDRLAAKQYLDLRCAKPTQIVHLGEDRVGLLMPWLDELASLSASGLLLKRYFRAQSLLFAVLDVVVPRMGTTDQPAASVHGRVALPSLPRCRPVQFLAGGRPQDCGTVT